MNLRLRQSRDNWRHLREMAPEKLVQNRDVYGDQQLARSEMGEMQTMTTRLIAVWAVAIFAFLVVWLFVSLSQFLAAAARGEAVIPVVTTGGSAGVSTSASETASGASSSPAASVPVPVDPGGGVSSAEDWDTVFDDELPLEGDPDGGDSSAPGVDATGASAPTSGGYAAARGMTYEQFRDTYFYGVSGGFITMYANRVTGEKMTSGAVYDLWVSVTGGDQASYEKLYGDGAAMTPGDVSTGVDVPVAGDASSPAGDASGSGAGVSDLAVSSGSSSGSSGGAGAGGVTSPATSSGGSQGAGAQGDVRAVRKATPKDYVFKFTFGKFVLSLAVAAAAWAFMYEYMKRNLESQNADVDVTDINQYPNDQHIALPEEVQRSFDWFPDVGAHSPVQVSSMISHVALQNKGLKTVRVTRRAEKDVRSKSGEVVYLKGEVLLDTDGVPIRDTRPMIDEKFSEALFDASGVLKPRRRGFNFRRRFDATQIPYNPGNENRGKLRDAETVADMINKYWTFPQYEPQRPSGAYIVDTDPVNTMVLAITRAGKGQTIIEPTLDMWTREEIPSNMIINDPKGELLVKFYVRGTVRGFQIVQFNLINAMKTDIYNPLGLAAESAREGDFTKCAQYVEDIAEVFFPVDGADDPVWPNAANNAFKRAAYGLIDYYLEEEKEIRIVADAEGWDEKVLETKLDQLWGHVTLYNCYQLFVQLTAKKLKNPTVEFTARLKNGDFAPLGPDEDPNNLRPGRQPMDDEEVDALAAEATALSALWENKPECDLLTLFFNATDGLPANSMRRLIGNANNALRSMAGAEKMLASVYGIAITAMSFFTDPTISTLTSGTPSQNVDLGGLSFPRRLGVRFHADFVTRYSLLGMQARWESFEDKKFEKNLGKDFYHEDLITREGWAMYYFKGMYEKDVAYLRLQIVNPKTGMLVRTFYFEFRKSYQMSLDARYYVTDPVLGEKMVKNGILIELRSAKTDKGVVRYKKAKTTFAQQKVLDVWGGGKKETVQTPAIIRTMVRYSEKQKMVFLVTPPHLMKYAKLILILVSQLVKLNFDKSYMTKSNQKPLYRTRFMLDELGNLQSEGHGIANFQTMLSIGLGQEQQFTLILQTLQQLKDVYGDSVDKIVQGNTSNIVFLKSTDDAMLDTLQKMSGTTHRVFKDSKTITKDKSRLFMRNEGKVSITISVKEQPVISYNDMAFIPMCNSIIFRAGNSPIWNRNETALPMSWRLFSNTIIQPGKDYSLQSIPTLSSALDFDVRKNQPNFIKLWEKRRDQFLQVEAVREAYATAYGFSEDDILALDQDNYADELMAIVNRELRNRGGSVADPDEDPDADPDAGCEEFDDPFGGYEDNEAVAREVSRQADAQRDFEKPIFAGRTLSRSALVSESGMPRGGLDDVLAAAYSETYQYFRKDPGPFDYDDRGRVLRLDGEVLIRQDDYESDNRRIAEAAADPSSRTFGGKADVGRLPPKGYVVKSAFYKALASLDSWDGFAEGRFDAAVKTLMARRAESDSDA